MNANQMNAKATQAAVADKQHLDSSKLAPGGDGWYHWTAVDSVILVALMDKRGTWQGDRWMLTANL